MSKDRFNKDEKQANALLNKVSPQLDKDEKKTDELVGTLEGQLDEFELNTGTLLGGMASGGKDKDEAQEMMDKFADEKKSDSKKKAKVPTESELEQRLADLTEPVPSESALNKRLHKLDPNYVTSSVASNDNDEDDDVSELEISQVIDEINLKIEAENEVIAKVSNRVCKEALKDMFESNDPSLTDADKMVVADDFINLLSENETNVEKTVSTIQNTALNIISEKTEQQTPAQEIAYSKRLDVLHSVAESAKKGAIADIEEITKNNRGSALSNPESKEQLAVATATFKKTSFIYNALSEIRHFFVSLIESIASRFSSEKPPEVKQKSCQDAIMSTEKLKQSVMKTKENADLAYDNGNGNMKKEQHDRIVARCNHQIEQCDRIINNTEKTAKMIELTTHKLGK